MKHFFSVLLCILVAGTAVQAQKVELNALTSYMFGASNDFYYNSSGGNLYFDGSVMYGGAIDIDLRNNVVLELQYMFQPTTVRLEGSFNPADAGSLDINNHLIQIGGLYNRDLSNKATLFGGLLFGMEVFAPTSSRYDSETRFLGSLTGGTKIWLSEKVGLRLNAMLSMPMIFSGAGFYLGTGGGGYGVSTAIQLFQFSLGGGIVVRM